MLADLFGEELQKIQDSELRSKQSELGSSRAQDEIIRSFTMRNLNNSNKNQIKLSERERESENMNYIKQKKF
jgi:hypothetical protein